MTHVSFNFGSEALSDKNKLANVSMGYADKNCMSIPIISMHISVMVKLTLCFDATKYA